MTVHCKYVNSYVETSPDGGSVILLNTIHTLFKQQESFNKKSCNNFYTSHSLFVSLHSHSQTENMETKTKIILFLIIWAALALLTIALYLFLKPEP